MAFMVAMSDAQHEELRDAVVVVVVVVDGSCAESQRSKWQAPRSKLPTCSDHSHRFRLLRPTHPCMQGGGQEGPSAHHLETEPGSSECGGIEIALDESQQLKR